MPWKRESWHMYERYGTVRRVHRFPLPILISRCAPYTEMILSRPILSLDTDSARN
jgi:hypothetical protein